MVLIAQGCLGLAKPLGLSLGYSDKQLSLAGSLGGICNCVGRIVNGGLLDRLGYKIMINIEAFFVLGALLSFHFAAQTNIYFFTTMLCLLYFNFAGKMFFCLANCEFI